MYVQQDLHSVDLEEFKYGGTNITALRLLDPERADVQRVVRDWVYDEARKGRKLQLGHTTAKVCRATIKLYYISTNNNGVVLKIIVCLQENMTFIKVREH